MASSYMLRALCTSHLLCPSSDDRPCCRNALQCRRRAAGRPALLLARWHDPAALRSGFSLLPPRRTRSRPRPSGRILSDGNVTGQANAVAGANAGTALANPLAEEGDGVSETSSAETNGSAAPEPPEPDFGPEFDLQVYSANTMIGYEPPPPPRIPFGGPYEDYYDEYVGVDYVPKQEKPTSSFLMFLESLNEKRAEEEAKLREKDPSRPPFNPTPNKHLFEGSKPLFTIPRPIQPAHIPRDYSPPSLDPNEDATPRRIFSPMPPKKPKPPPQPQPQPTVTAPAEETAELAEAKSVTTPLDAEVLPSEAAVSASQDVGVEEFSPTSAADVTLPSPSEGSIASVRPLGLDDSSSPPSSSASFAPPTAVTEEPSFGGRMSVADAVDAGSLPPSGRPFQPTSSTPLVSSARPFEAPADPSGSLFPPKSVTSASVEPTAVIDEPVSFAGKAIEENKRVNGETRSFEDFKDERVSSFPTSRVEESKPSVSSGPMVSPPGRPSEFGDGSGAFAFPQTRPYEQSGSFLQDQPVAGSIGTSSSAPQSLPFSPHADFSQGMPPQTDERILDGPGEMIRTSEFYEPNDGHIVLGAVTYADEDELSLEIGGRVPALMTMRDFQPFIEIGPDSFFKMPSDDASNESSNSSDTIPYGKVLFVEDSEANDGIYRGENVNVGTIVVAEVYNKALVEGRPVLTCRRLARSLAFVRIEQIMRTGEAVHIEISQFNEGGLQGYLEGVRCFLPRSELLRRPESSAALQGYVGKTLRVAVLQAEEYSSNVIISEVRLWMSENLLLGTVHDLVITKIHPYGLQVEVIGTRIRGFIHISSISRGYVTTLLAFFEEREEIKAMLIKSKKPGQVSFSIEAIEPPAEEGLFLRDKETVYYGAEDVAKSTPEYQLPLEERRIFAVPTSATSVILQSSVANLAWLELEKLRNPC